jgi:hypothetical protein
VTAFPTLFFLSRFLFYFLTLHFLHIFLGNSLLSLSVFVSRFRLVIITLVFVCFFPPFFNCLFLFSCIFSLFLCVLFSAFFVLLFLYFCLYIPSFFFFRLFLSVVVSVFLIFPCFLFRLFFVCVSFSIFSAFSFSSVFVYFLRASCPCSI